MDPVSLRRHVELDISADSLWELVASPEHLAGWLGDAVDLRIEPGGTGVVIDDEISRFVHVDRVDDGRALGFTWWEADGEMSRVELEIISLPGGGSRLDITETLAAGAAAVTAEAAAERWEVRVCALWACTVVAALVM
jgi:uncharacterized protein YndB with AHSA1/START domain